MTQILSRCPAETEQAGERIASVLSPGDIVALTGGLGMGKTVLVRGLARGLGIDCDVSSPTFTIIHEYRGPSAKLCHVDAYRLGGQDELPETGFYDYLDAGWIAAVEWSERLALFAAVTVDIRRVDDETRIICMEGKGL